MVSHEFLSSGQNDSRVSSLDTPPWFTNQLRIDMQKILRRDILPRTSWYISELQPENGRMLQFWHNPDEHVSLVEICEEHTGERSARVYGMPTEHSIPTLVIGGIATIARGAYFDSQPIFPLRDSQIIKPDGLQQFYFPGELFDLPGLADIREQTDKLFYYIRNSSFLLHETWIDLLGDEKVFVQQYQNHFSPEEFFAIVTNVDSQREAVPDFVSRLLVTNSTSYRNAHPERKFITTFEWPRKSFATKSELLFDNWPEIQEARDEPTHEWVWSNFRDIVRLNNPGEKNSSYPERRILEDLRWDSVPKKLLEIPLVDPRRESSDTATQLLTILLHKQFRAGSLKHTSGAYLNFLRDKIQMCIKEDSPIELVLPSLPFKDQNPLNTGHSAAFVDLGEWLFFSRLAALSNSVRQLHSPGLHTTILSDGVVYADIFAGGDVQSGISYRENCRRVIDSLGLSGEIQIEDMKTVTDQFDAFETIRKKIREILETGYRQDDLRSSLESLCRGMFFNMQMPEKYNSYETVSQLARVSLEEFTVVASDLSGQIHAAAIAYASFLLASRFLKTIETTFPRAIRATVHPKDGQLGIRMTKSNLAVYNGVPLVDAAGGSIEIRRLWEVYRKDNVAAVYVGTDIEPFFYAANMVK